MKLLFASFLFLQINVYADYGPAYNLKVEVTYTKGIVTGYIDMFCWDRRTQELPSAFLNNDKKFTQLFKDKFNQRNTIYLCKEIYRIDSLMTVIHFSDEEVLIPVKDIMKMKLKSYTELSVGTWVDATHLKSSDLIWIKMKPVSKESYQNFHCSYTIFFFEKKIISAEFEKNKKKYVEMNYYDLEMNGNEEEWDKILHKYFKMLQKQKVLIISECSC